MSDTILVEYDPFNTESRVSIYGNNSKEYINVSSEIEELTKALVTTAYKHNIYNVKVHGPFAIASQLNHMIAEYENKQYSASKIKVEGF